MSPIFNLPINVAFLPSVRLTVYNISFIRKVTLPVTLPVTTAIKSVPFWVTVIVGSALGMLGKNFLVFSE